MHCARAFAVSPLQVGVLRSLKRKPSISAGAWLAISTTSPRRLPARKMNRFDDSGRCQRTHLRARELVCATCAREAWLDGRLAGSAQVGLPWPSLVSFLRLVTNRRVFERPESTDSAWHQVLAWLACDSVWIP